MRYEAPDSLEGAVALLAGAQGEARVLAGGTDLLVQMRADVLDPDLIVDIKKIKETRAVTEEKGGWRIGAAVTGAELKEHARLKKAWPGVVEAANLIGSTQVQGRATLGGNLCNGSPAADSVPALIAAGAVATLIGPRGKRDLPVEDVMLGPRKLALQKGEIVASFLLPPRAARSSDAYLRFIPRTEMDIAVVGAGVSLTVDGAGIVTAARVSLGAVAARVLLVAEAAQAIVGSRLDAAGAGAARGGGAGGLPSHRRQAGHDGIPNPGRGRAGTPGGPDRAGPGEEQQLMAKHHIEATVNGDAVEFLCETEDTLLDVLRDTLNLTGSKEGCASGDCGACSVMLDGRLVCSCLVLGCEVGGHRVETIEGMAKGESLHPLQQKFLEHAALQCGICTPGVLVAAQGPARAEPRPDGDRDPLLAGRQPVPVHRLRQDRERGEGRRRGNEKGLDPWPRHGRRTDTTNGQGYRRHAHDPAGRRRQGDGPRALRRRLQPARPAHRPRAAQPAPPRAHRLDRHVARPRRCPA